MGTVAQVEHVMDMSINIRMAENGVILRYDDPKIESANREEDSKYEDPTVELVFKDAKEAMPEVQRVLKMLMGPDSADEDEFDSAFDEAMEDE
jgi:predicted RNA polymerase sigma factor